MKRLSNGSPAWASASRRGCAQRPDSRPSTTALAVAWAAKSPDNHPDGDWRSRRSGDGVVMVSVYQGLAGRASGFHLPGATGRGGRGGVIALQLHRAGPDIRLEPLLGQHRMHRSHAAATIVGM